MSCWTLAILNKNYSMWKKAKDSGESDKYHVVAFYEIQPWAALIRIKIRNSTNTNLLNLAGFNG